MSHATQCTNLLFAAPYQLTFEQKTLPEPAIDQVLVQTLVSAISAGTELLFYRGQVPDTMSVDATIGALGGAVTYPLPYGYALVGVVTAVGTAVDPKWQGQRVFAFHPHTTHFLTTPGDLIAVPDDVTNEQAVLLPNMETAVNFVQDGAPMLGERVVVLGQGIVGLLTTALLAQFPLTNLLTVDRLALRRERSATLGAQTTCEAIAPEVATTISADLVFELTGNPAALNTAIACTGYDGRVLIGSWYGRKQAAIHLGGHFHRSRIRLISSQVSTIAPQHQGRWSKARRFDLAWAMLRKIDPTHLVTHRFSLHEATQAYTLLDQQAADVLQVLFCYQE
jgi:2-desacetyl-2-hydroxyethyl bacteriochlorophyllide A dehydrogenase